MTTVKILILKIILQEENDKDGEWQRVFRHFAFNYNNISRYIEAWNF